MLKMTSIRTTCKWTVHTINTCMHLLKKQPATYFFDADNPANGGHASQVCMAAKQHKIVSVSLRIFLTLFAARGLCNNNINNSAVPVHSEVSHSVNVWGCVFVLKRREQQAMERFSALSPQTHQRRVPSPVKENPGSKAGDDDDGGCFMLMLINVLAFSHVNWFAQLVAVVNFTSLLICYVTYTKIYLLLWVQHGKCSSGGQKVQTYPAHNSLHHITTFTVGWMDKFTSVSDVFFFVLWCL